MREYSQRPLNPGDLFALKFVHDARVSPDGRCVAYVTSRTIEATAEELFDITIVQLDSDERRKISFDGSTTCPRWSSDGQRIAFIGEVGGSARLYVYDVASGQVSAISPKGHSVSGPPDWSPDGRMLVYTVLTRPLVPGIRRITRRVFRAEDFGDVEGLRSVIQIIDLASGAVRVLAEGIPVALKPTFSPCGKRVLMLAADAAAADQALVGGFRLCTIEIGNGSRTEVLGEGWFIASAAWSPCGERIVFAGARNSSLIVPSADLWVVNRDGSHPECRTPELKGTIGFRMHHDMPTWSTSQDSMLRVVTTTHALATVLKGGCAEIWRIALTGACHAEPVVSGNRCCLIMDADNENSRLLYCVTDLNHPWDLFHLDLRRGEEKALTRLNHGVLDEWPELRVEPLQIRSHDDRVIEGWYMARADRQGLQPTVMFIHGGPMLAVGHMFRFDFHLLAANGFAVVFGNFRGSSGYGEGFMRALAGEWGSRGFPDHMATVDAAVERGLADPARLGVWGPSHGGYATCWIVTHTSRFRAAVAEASCTNFFTMYYLSDAPDLWMKDLGGRPDEIPDIYRSQSPLTYASACRTPTLMLHGEEDLRCPVAEAEQFYRALHDAGCVTEMVIVPGMGHMGDSIGPLPARHAQNQSLLDWFERYL